MVFLVLFGASYGESATAKFFEIQVIIANKMLSFLIGVFHVKREREI